MKLLLLAFITMSFFACNQSQKTDNDIDLSMLNSDNILPLSSLYDSISYVKLETTSECLIGNIKKIIPSANQYFIFDEEYFNIFIFDTNGKFLKKIGKRGTGPNEYIKIDDICFDRIQNRLFVLDNTRNRILVYNNRGEDLYYITLAFKTCEIEFLSGNIILCYNDFKVNNKLQKDEKYPLITLIDADNGKVLSSNTYFSHEIQSKEVIAPFSATSTNGTSVSVFNALTSTISAFHKNGEVKEYTLNFGSEDTQAREKYISKLHEKQLNAHDVCSGCEHQPDYTMITSVFKEKEYLYISTVNYIKKKQYFIRYNLNTSNCIYAKSSTINPFINDIDYGKFLLIPNSIENGKAYGYIDALSLCYHAENNDSTNNESLKCILKHTKEEDNPILFIATLNL